MSNVIDFLERMGQDAQLRYAGGEQLAQTLIEAGVEPGLHAAVLGGRAALETLLGADANVCCLVHAPSDDDDEEQEKEQARSAAGTSFGSNRAAKVH